MVGLLHFVTGIVITSVGPWNIFTKINKMFLVDDTRNYVLYKNANLKAE